MIPFTDLASQYKEAKKAIDDAINETIAKSSFITGPDVQRFEETIADYCGAEDCASTGSGTMALQIALKACGIGPGDEVITVSHTFLSTVEAIVNVGATPIMVDIDQFYLIEPTYTLWAISKKTKAILVVDLYGQCPEMEEFRKFADAADIFLIADAAQSFGASRNGHKVGSLADLTCVSFNPVKNLGAMGDAGCILGRRDLIEKARLYRDHGRTSKYNSEVFGYNGRIDNLQANIILAKLPYLDNWISTKNRIAQIYNEKLNGYVETPKTIEGNYHSFHVYCIQTDARDLLQGYLHLSGIQTNIHYPIPCHQQIAVLKNSSIPINHLNGTVNACERILSLPCYPSLTTKNQLYIIENIQRWIDTRDKKRH